MNLLTSNMVVHRKNAKTSNLIKRWKTEIALLPPPEQLAFYDAHLPLFAECATRDINEMARTLLLDVANLREGGWKNFWRSHMGLGLNPLGDTPCGLDERCVYGLRDSLRKIWERNLSIRDIDIVLNDWLSLETRRWVSASRQIGLPETYRVPWIADVRVGRLLPNLDLPALLVTAVLEHFQRMLKCSNPDCTNPYFIAKRKSQKFCEQGPCTRYAQNQYAKKWWRENKRRESSKDTAPPVKHLHA